ncbi:MAG: hypothetical protein J1G07_01485 [Clostridiales bacterium]|nr:hypothetical protein [Clostridiales bacterium]
MRTVLYKSGFLRYFSSLLEYCEQSKRKRGFYGMFVFFMALTFILNETSWTWFSAVLLAGIAIHLGELRNSTPNVVSLSPYKPTQKLIYAWLSPLLYFVLALATMLFIRVFFLSIFSLYGLLVGFEVYPIWQYAFAFDPAEEMGAYGILFGLIFQLACYSAGMFSSFIKKWSNKAIFIFAFCVVVYLCLQFMSLPYSLTLEKGIRFIGFFAASPFYDFGYKYMQYPWLAVLLCGVAMFAFFGFTVWFTARKNRGKDY